MFRKALAEDLDLLLGSLRMLCKKIMKYGKEPDLAELLKSAVK